MMGMPITVDVGKRRRRHPRGRLRLLRLRRSAFQHLPRRTANAGDQSRRGWRSRLQRRHARGSRARRATPRARPTGISTSAAPTERIDPSGIVKGWAIRNAAMLIACAGARRLFRRRRRRHPVGRHATPTASPGASASAIRSIRTEIVKVVRPAGARRRHLGHLRARPAHLRPARSRRVRCPRSSASPSSARTCWRPTASPPPPSPWGATASPSSS